MNNYIPRSLSKLFGECFCQLLLLLTVSGAITSYSPGMPQVGLDSSWEFALNQAMAQGLTFGKDIIFTFGPYVSLYTHRYHPAIDTTYFMGGLYLTTAYWLCLAVMMRGEKLRWYVIVSVVVFLFLVHQRRDVAVFTYPLIACIACHRLLKSYSAERKSKIYSSIIITILFSGFGLITLIKGSIIPLYCIVTFLCCLFFLCKNEYYFALLSIFSFLASIVVFWILAHQPLASLIGYFTSMFPVISGYSDAMSVSGPISEIILFIVTYGMLLYMLWKGMNIHIHDKLFIVLVNLFIGFCAFKAGFVRHDGHKQIASLTLCFTVAIMAVNFRSEKFFTAIIICTIAWICIIDVTYRNHSISRPHARAFSIYIQQPKQFLKWFADRSARKTRFDAALQNIQRGTAFPILTGTSDIYSCSQSELLASGNAWLPRPNFQSYGAYTPALVMANKAHLLSEAAPDNIFFRVEPIDRRLPSLDDGASWPVLLARYSFDRLLPNNVALLRKREHAPVATDAAAAPAPPEWEIHSLGEAVDVPRPESPVFVKIAIKPTLLGRILTFLFKPAHLWLHVRLADGEERRFRFIAGMGETGFFLSPLIETTEEFSLLYADWAQPLAAKTVAWFSLSTGEGGGKRQRLAKWQWQNHFAVQFSYEDIPLSGSDQPSRKEMD